MRAMALAVAQGTDAMNIRLVSLAAAVALSAATSAAASQNTPAQNTSAQTTPAQGQATEPAAKPPANVQGCPGYGRVAGGGHMMGGQGGGYGPMMGGPPGQVGPYGPQGQGMMRYGHCPQPPPAAGPAKPGK